MRRLALLLMLALPGAHATASDAVVALMRNSVPQAQINPQSIRLPVIDANDLKFTRLGTNDGLSQMRVSHITQDAEGFMWFGTQYGLNRYDGYKFKVFTPEAQGINSIGGVYIHSLFKDATDNLWIGSDELLDKFDPATERFTHYRIAPPSQGGAVVTHIGQDHTGMLWFATGKGLYRFDPSTAHSTLYKHDPLQPSSLGSSDIKSTGEDREGQFWVVTANGLDLFDRDTGKVTLHVPLEESRDMSFYEDSAGTFWIFHASGTGLAIFDRKTTTLTHISLSSAGALSLPQQAVYALIEDHDGTLWLGGDAGLLRYNRSSNSFTRYRHRFGDEESVSGNSVTAIHEDREGNIWVALHGTEINILVRKRLPFEILPRSPGSERAESERMVNGIYEDNEGVLWISYVGAFTTVDRGRGKQKLIDLPSRKVTADVVPMVEGPGQVMWFGTIGGGLVQLDKKTDALRNYRHDPADSSSISSDVVERLMFDSKGALWAATWDGLNRFDAGTGRFKTYKVDEQQSRAQFYLDLAEDPHGIIWLGSNYSGLHRFDPGTGRFTVYEHHADEPSSVSNNRVNSVHIDRAGTIWLGTQNGLDRFDDKTGRFTRYFEQDGLGGNVVSCILEDAHGALWMSTNKGISRFDPLHQTFSSYSRADGLPGGDLTGWGACFKSQHEELLFGGFSGAAAFFPDLPTDTGYAPPVVLTAFELSGISVGIGGDSPLRQSISHTNDLTLNHRDNTFSIEFSALSFSSPTTNRYRYKLDGLDSSWHTVGSDRRIASYTTLVPGHYTFHVQGARGRGSWSEPGATLRITILRPWWSTWWFRSIVAGLVAFAAICIYYYRVLQIARQFEIRFEERLGERSRIARELHDSLLQGFQALIIHLQAIRDMLPGRSIEAAQALERALDRGDKAIEEGRHAVQNLRSTTEGGEDLTEALQDLESELMSHGSRSESPTYRLVTEGKSHALDPMLRDEVYGIAREAFRNAVRHAKARKIEVEVAFGERRFCLRVRDDGLGLDPHVMSEGQRPGHWGLPGMRERAQQFGGVLSVWSTPGGGTEVELAIPAPIAYRKITARPKFWRWKTKGAGVS